MEDAMKVGAVIVPKSVATSCWTRDGQPMGVAIHMDAEQVDVLLTTAQAERLLSSLFIRLAALPTATAPKGRQPDQSTMTNVQRETSS